MVEVKGGFVEEGRMEDGCVTVVPDRAGAVVTVGTSLSCFLLQGSDVDRGRSLMMAKIQ